MARTTSRRTFLQTAAVGALTPWLVQAGEPARRPRVAVIYTVLRFRSHAFNFLENCLRPLLFNGKLIQPAIEVVSVYADQRVEEGDMTDDVVRHRRARRLPGERPGANPVSAQAVLRRDRRRHAAEQPLRADLQ
jgi:hypothetical protein